MFNIKNFEQISYSMINWMNNLAPNISDFFVGSVVRTLLESVALELEEMYWRTYSGLAEAQAEGVYAAFDFPRDSAKNASGYITFYASASGADILIPSNVLVGTIGTENRPEILFENSATTYIYRGTGVSEEILYRTGTTSYATRQRLIDITQAVAVQVMVGGVATTLTPTTDFTINSSSSTQHYIVFTGTTIIDDASYFKVIYKPLSAEIWVQCSEAGTIGNVGAGNIQRVKGAITGVAGVVNHDSLTNGSDIESDSDRRHRFSQYVGSLSRGTMDAIRYAIFNKTSKYRVFSAHILENSPIPGFIKIYAADDTGFAGVEMLADVQQAIEPYRGAGIVVNVASPTKILIDVYCKLRLKDGYNTDIVQAQVLGAINDHLSGYKYVGDGDYSTVYLTNLDYIIKNTRPEAIIEADVSFKRATTPWTNILDPLNPKMIEDITPAVDGVQAEIFRPGTITVGIW